MKSKIGFVCLVAVVVALSLVFYGAANAEEMKVKKNVATDQAQKSRGEGKDENIKNETLKNNPNAKIPAPPNKGGEKGRAPFCYLGVDNRTQWIIRIYVDGVNVGAVSPWGDATGTYDRGSHQFYAVAYFDGTPALTWGPRTTYCDGPYTWTLNP